MFVQRVDARQPISLAAYDGHTLCESTRAHAITACPACPCTSRPTFSEILDILNRLRQKLGGHTPALGRYQPQPALLAERERAQIQAATEGGTQTGGLGTSSLEQQKKVGRGAVIFLGFKKSLGGACRPTVCWGS